MNKIIDYKQYKNIIIGCELLITSCLFFILHKTGKYIELATFFTKKTEFSILCNLMGIFIAIGTLFIIVGVFNIFKNDLINISRIIIILLKSLNLLSIISCIYIFIIGNVFLILTISGSSMLPTIHNQDQVTVICSNIVNYEDIIVFNVNSEDNLISYGNSYYIKRVIGLPGDTVTFIDKILKVNGEIINESYFDEEYLLSIEEYDDFNGVFSYKLNNQILTCDIIPEGYVFVLGDNRNKGKSNDSPEIGLIRIENIVGIVK